MKKIESLKQLAEFFWRLEEEFDLINFKIGDIKVWQYQRFRIFNELTIATGLYKRAHTKKNGFFDILKVSGSLLYYSLFSNPLTGNYHRDFLIFGTGRKVKVDDKFIDIYTEYFVNELKEDTFEIIEELYVNKHFPSKKKARKHQDFQQIRTFIKSRLSTFSFKQSQIEFISKIENRISEVLDTDINLLKLFRNGYLTFKYDFEFYDKLLKKRKPEKIFLVCSYGYKMALIAAAKQNKIEVTEIQHGTMDKFHLGYSYPNHSYIDYFPDKIYFFGEYWKNCMHFPLREENKLVYGFPYFQQQKRKYNAISKKEGTVLIISQGTIGNKLSNFIWESSEMLSNYRITYKLHPGEYDRWKIAYPDLQKLSEQKNITLIDNNETNLYAYLAESEFVIGVYSTAIYEALSFNCKVVIIDLPGVEYMEDLIAKDFAKLAKTKDELKYYIEKSKLKQVNSELFFA